MRSVFYDIYDPDTGKLLETLGTDSCNPYEPNERCGGCSECLRMQAMSSGLHVVPTTKEVWCVRATGQYLRNEQRKEIVRGICESLIVGGAVVLAPYEGFMHGTGVLERCDKDIVIHGVVFCVKTTEWSYGDIQWFLSNHSVDDVLIVSPNGYCRWNCVVEAADFRTHQVRCARTENHYCIVRDVQDLKRALYLGAKNNGHYHWTHPLAGTRHG